MWGVPGKAAFTHQGDVVHVTSAAIEQDFTEEELEALIEAAEAALDSLTAEPKEESDEDEDESESTTPAKAPAKATTTKKA